MTGTVELDPDGAFLLLRFAYREDLVAEVKNLPERRWDPKTKTWRIPARHAELVYSTFVRHLFEFAPEIMSLIAGTLGTAPAKAADKPRSRQEGPPLAAATAGDDPEAPPPALSISALNQRVRDALKGQFPQPLWVVGEIVDFDKSASRQHRFFSLVEKARGQARPAATVEVALFERTAQRLLPRLAAGADPLTLRDGIEIRALVNIDLYPATGRYQVIIEDIDPSFTLGKMALTREQILRELREQGLVERNRSLGVPIPPLRVAVLTSPESDGWNDFLKHLEESRIGFEVTLVPIRVQGIELKPSLLAGLNWLAPRADRFDVLCILRGGGSRTDLAWFDDRDIALAVARHPLKVLVGIGHQRDQSVLDAIAHSEKTPTAVAEFLVDCVREARTTVREQARRLQQVLGRQLAHARQDLGIAVRELQQGVRHRLQHERTFVALAARKLGDRALALVWTTTVELMRSGRDLHTWSRLCLHRGRAALAADQARLTTAGQRQIDRAQARLDQQTARQRLLDPARVLGRGYALVRGADGRILTSAAGIRRDQTLDIELRDGIVRTRAEDVLPPKASS
ncbi:MAG: exodeoxyribonuclease VII large subunit [Planctomycetes bacterium]|nr:exodeoxyribonuclease VII large subunit [Planctomycetota bacterium]